MSETQGGSGGRCIQNKRQTRLVARALRERWNIPTEMRGTVIARLGQIVDDSKTEPREVISAAKAILSAGKLNLDNIEIAIKAIEHLALEARMTEVEQLVEENRRAREPYARS